MHRSYCYLVAVCSTFLSATSLVGAEGLPLEAIGQAAISETEAVDSLLIGVAETDITPPIGFPMAGYYHERLAEGHDRSAEGQGDRLSRRRHGGRAGRVRSDRHRHRPVARSSPASAARTGIPVSNIVIAATHSHTAPDYMKELYLYLGKEQQEQLRAEYIEKLIGGPVDAITRSSRRGAGRHCWQPARPRNDAGRIQPPLRHARRQRADVAERSPIRKSSERPDRSIRRSVCSRFVIGRRHDSAESSATSLCISTRSAGSQWSADYPFFIERTLREAAGADVISIFGTGCCGDINHVNPSSPRSEQGRFHR